MSEATEPTAPAPETQETPAAETPVETPAAQEQQPTPEASAEQKPEQTETPAEQKPAKTLLDDEDETPAEQKPEAEAPAAEADVETFCRGIDATDLGDGVTWSDETLKAMAPSLMELTGNDPKKANGVVKAYADFMQKQARLQQEAAEAFNNGLIEECRQKFGPDLRKVARLARDGGRAIFGDQLWTALKSTPAFANNPDVLERLADYGRRLSEDNGAVKPTEGKPAQDESDVLHRMYGNVKVG